MKNKTLVFALLPLLMTAGCWAPGYIPEVEDIDVNPYGGYLEITNAQGQTAEGELIAIDDEKVTILVDPATPKETLRTMAIEHMYRYRLHYAQPVDYTWTIPLFSLFTITHGWFLVLTFPVNLITTIAVTVGGETAFRYTEKEISLQDLRMFARFPQGMPENFMRK
ncbi:MAG: hypothetical protein IH600_17495 [Bacteroidetes bacterium]|nr:hypothetical protein [Bacteroidota bacterium]